MCGEAAGGDLAASVGWLDYLLYPIIVPPAPTPIHLLPDKEEKYYVMLDGKEDSHIVI